MEDRSYLHNYLNRMPKQKYNLTEVCRNCSIQKKPFSFQEYNGHTKYLPEKLNQSRKKEKERQKTETHTKQKNRGQGKTTLKTSVTKTNVSHTNLLNR